MFGAWTKLFRLSRLRITIARQNRKRKAVERLKLTHYPKLIDILVNSFTCDAVPGSPPALRGRT